MSANDVFIFSSLMQRRVAALTWVWPSWDVAGQRHTKLDPSEKIEGRLGDIANAGFFVLRGGSISTTNRRGERIEVGCSCLFYNSSRKRFRCEMGDDKYEADMTARHNQYQVLEIDKLTEKECVFKEEMMSQHVSELEMAAGKYTQMKHLYSELASLVLDIDEDFFGVLTKRDAELKLGALPESDVTQIARVLRLLKPRTVRHEVALNDAVRRDVHSAWQQCWSLPSSTPKCPRHFQLLSSESKSILAELAADASSSESEVRKMNDALVAIVRSSANAAHLLNSVGFCLMTTPSTFREPSGGFAGDGKQQEGRGMKLCSDRPKDHQVEINDPSLVTRANSMSPFEVARRLEVLEHALAQERERPAVVTVCRSVRDGYTPPALWKQIETGLMGMLERLYGELNVHYDANLLGGPEGWHRHARPVG